MDIETAFADDQSMATPYDWQMLIWRQYVKAFDEGRLAHALLFHGMSGLGKKTFAKALARFLLCDARLPERACGVCHRCLLIKAQTHPDLLLVEPQEKSVVIKVDQIRALNDFVAQTAQQGGQKVVILAPAERMNVAAANAFLKCLEEPTPNTTLILISENLGEVLPTVRSRCQRALFAPPSQQSALAWLQKKVSPQDRAEQLLKLTDNRPLTALDMHEAQGLETRNSIVKDLGALIDSSISVVALAQRWLDEDPERVFFWLLGFSGDMLRWYPCRGTDAETRCLKNTDLLDFYAKVLDNGDYLGLFHLTDELMQVQRQLKGGSNANKQMVFEFILIQWLEWIGGSK